ncbi:MAG TPA: hypothetical protein VK610_05460, partial [Rhodothermales bacterium]|nr:hypothetical protein [Rhodothermales bacterium]
IDERIVSTPAQDRQLLDRLLARTRRKAALVRDLMARHAPDLTVAVFAETHTGGHQLWPYRRDAKGDGFRPPGDLGDGLLALYQETDRALATVLAAAPPETTVLVVSSFGMKAMYPTEGLTEAVCRDLVYQATPDAAPADAGTRRPDVMDLLRRLLPGRLRDGLSRFLSYETQARLFSQKYERATDWARTTAFAVPGYYTGEVRVNLRGREPQGIVEPGADYDALLGRLESDFLALTHPETGERVVDRVVRVRDVFGADLHPALPDLHVLWQPHARFLDRVVHPRAVITQPPHPLFRASDHTTEGFLAFAGPGLKAAGRVPDVSPLALAPTLLNLLGVPVPDTMPEPPLSFI